MLRLAALLSCLSLLVSAAPAKAPKEHAALSTLIPSAPHFVVYSDAWFGSGQPPAASTLSGYNTFILSFLLLSGPADQAVSWAQLDSATRNSVIADYHSHGIALMVSAFGSTDAPTSSNADPVATAHSMAAWVKQYGLDGIDVDYEDFNAINAQNGKAEQWLKTFTTTLRGDLPAGQYIITHAPIAPWLTDSTSRYPTGAYHAVAQSVGNQIDWFNLQYYNQGNDYTSCNSLLFTSESDFPHTSVFEINQYSGVALSKLVIGKPAISGTDANSGYVAPDVLAGCLAQGKAKGWNGGAMYWQYPHATSSLITQVRAQSWPVSGGGGGTPTTSTTSPSPTSGSCKGVSAWNAGTVYTGGQTATYSGHLWTAKWWTQGDTPGGSAGVWTQGVAC